VFVCEERGAYILLPVARSTYLCTRCTYSEMFVYKTGISACELNPNKSHQLHRLSE